MLLLPLVAFLRSIVLSATTFSVALPVGSVKWSANAGVADSDIARRLVSRILFI